MCTKLVFYHMFQLYQKSYLNSISMCFTYCVTNFFRLCQVVLKLFKYRWWCNPHGKQTSISDFSAGFFSSSSQQILTDQKKYSQLDAAGFSFGTSRNIWPQNSAFYQRAEIHAHASVVLIQFPVNSDVNCFVLPRQECWLVSKTVSFSPLVMVSFSGNTVLNRKVSGTL